MTAVSKSFAGCVLLGADLLPFHLGTADTSASCDTIKLIGNVPVSLLGRLMWPDKPQQQHYQAHAPL